MSKANVIAKQGRVRVSRRIHAEGYGVLVTGEERHPVSMIDVGLRGMCILAPTPLIHGTQVVLEVSEPFGVDAYRCRVAFCQEEEKGWQIGLEIEEQDARLLVISIPGD
ncbi:MAG: PilZ domain-containing protein [Magnetococcales bacterium]|nr:PilZ domain-containing protein [Magnetococcales bacterium]